MMLYTRLLYLNDTYIVNNDVLKIPPVIKIKHLKNIYSSLLVKKIMSNFKRLITNNVITDQMLLLSVNIRRMFHIFRNNAYIHSTVESSNQCNNKT